MNHKIYGGWGGYTKGEYSRNEETVPLLDISNHNFILSNYSLLSVVINLVLISIHACYVYYKMLVFMFVL